MRFIAVVGYAQYFVVFDEYVANLSDENMVVCADYFIVDDSTL